MQALMKQKLESLNIPAKEIKVFGKSIIVTCFSKDAADKWIMTLNNFARVRGAVESLDGAIENSGTTLCPSMVKVWRVGAAI